MSEVVYQWVIDEGELVGEQFGIRSVVYDHSFDTQVYVFCNSFLDWVLRCIFEAVLLQVGVAVAVRIIEVVSGEVFGV